MTIDDDWWCSGSIQFTSFGHEQHWGRGMLFSPPVEVDLEYVHPGRQDSPRLAVRIFVTGTAFGRWALQYHGLWITTFYLYTLVSSSHSWIIMNHWFYFLLFSLTIRTITIYDSLFITKFSMWLGVPRFARIFLAILRLHHSEDSAGHSLYRLPPRKLHAAGADRRKLWRCLAARHLRGFIDMNVQLVNWGS